MGCYKKWDKETCFNEAQKYRTKSEFAKCSAGAYQAAIRHNWLDDYNWFEWGGKWNKEACFEAAKKYKNKFDFSKYCGGAYASALKNKWLDDYTWFETNKFHKNANKWNKKNCFQEAKKYINRTDFEKGNQSAYQVARKNKWLDDYTWFTPRKKPNGYWNNYDNCFAEAQKYSSRSEFSIKNPSAYQGAIRNNWIDEYDWFVYGNKITSLAQTK